MGAWKLDAGSGRTRRAAEEMEEEEERERAEERPLDGGAAEDSPEGWLAWLRLDSERENGREWTPSRPRTFGAPRREPCGNVIGHVTSKDPDLAKCSAVGLRKLTLNLQVNNELIQRDAA